MDRLTNGPTDQRNDGPTDQRTDRRTDKASYRDAWTHLQTTSFFHRRTLITLKKCHLFRAKKEAVLSNIYDIFLTLFSYKWKENKKVAFCVFSKIRKVAFATDSLK